MGSRCHYNNTDRFSVWSKTFATDEIIHRSSEHPLWEVGQQQPKLYNNCQCLESSNCKQDWRAYWNLTSATKFNVGQYNESLRISA